MLFRSVVLTDVNSDIGSMLLPTELTAFLDGTSFDTIVSTVGIFLFLVLTAYDVKKIQAFHAYYGQAPEMAAKASIFSALQLYLDFINLFVYIMRILGRRK